MSMKSLIAFLVTFCACLPSAFAQSYSEPTETQNAMVFGQNLFTGQFSERSLSGFNPNYRLSSGDLVQIQIWGAIEYSSEQPVDEQGNIFIPQVGPIPVLGVANQELNEVVSAHLARIYSDNVYSYTSLNSAKPVNVYVTGNVIAPGLYPGLASDSILSYLDRAGGIDPDRGSFLDVRLLRQGEAIASFNLYDFLLHGDIRQQQMQEGDVIVVGARAASIVFSGLVDHPVRFEFSHTPIGLNEVAQQNRPHPDATHIRIERNQGESREVEYMELEEAFRRDVQLFDGDVVSYRADKIQASIGIVVEGEHDGPAEYVFARGARLSDLLAQIQPNAQSDLEAIQLYRRSLAQRQREFLLDSLNKLEAQVLSARSSTVEEAALRTQEAALILQFVERAKDIYPEGRVLIGMSADASDLILENGDRLVIPSRSRLITVGGEVLYPTAVVYRDDYSPEDFIELAGGFSQGADKSRVILRHPSGEVEELDVQGFSQSGSNVISPGDEILVLPAVDLKSMQYTMDLVQVIYQLALSAGVVLAL